MADESTEAFGKIRGRLALVTQIKTPKQGVQNDIVEVGPASVVVRSHRTGNKRTIPYRDLLRAAEVRTNGVIVTVLAQVVGLYGGPTDLDEARECSHVVTYYQQAKAWVEEHSTWSTNLDHLDAPITPFRFLEEYAWAVYVSGFKATTVRAKWPALRAAWKEFEPTAIDDTSAAAAHTVISNGLKTKAIRNMARRLTTTPWHELEQIYCESSEALGQLPWLGAANRRFLARNLGIEQVGKPDVWILRLAAWLGVEWEEMFEIIEAETGDDAAIADLLLWVYLSENPHALG